LSSFMDRVKPWACGTCGQKNISANKTECPKCHAPRPGSTQAQAEAATGQTTRTYEGEDAMREGIAQMAAQGWRVVSQTSYQPRAGVGRIALLGLGAAVIKPKPKFVVTFERTPASA
jgi:hypothetical protein